MRRSGCIWHIVSPWGCSRWRYQWGRGAGLRQYQPGGSYPQYLRRSRCSCFCKNIIVNLFWSEQQKASRAEYCTKCVERLKSYRWGWVSLKVLLYVPWSWAELDTWKDWLGYFLDFDFIWVLCYWCGVVVYSCTSQAQAHTPQFQHKV